MKNKRVMLSKALRINPVVVHRMLVDFIREEVHKVGFHKAVVGLSGGIDSSTVTALATQALGKENVLALLMPYATSSTESVTDAKEVVQQLGIRSVLIEITPMIDAYFKYLPEASALRRGNKMARERMSILYDFSAKEQALVLGTSNKTELLLGYGTQYGDMASAINPIGDLYKTQLRQLAQHLKIPTRIQKKVPTADLWAGQSDEAELGFTYLKVDTLLYYWIDERRSVSELLEMGFDKKFLELVQRKIQNSQFKRRLPVIAKLSQRTIDRDFRYGRDWGR